MGKDVLWSCVLGTDIMYYLAKFISLTDVLAASSKETNICSLLS